MDPGPADQQPQRPTRERQDDALSEQLPDDAPARSADRRADSDFAAAAGRPDQQQVRDVGAGDEQHKADRPSVDQQGLLDVAAYDHVADRLHAERPLRSERGRKLRAIILGRRLHPRVCLLQRDARLQPAERLKVVALIGRVRIELK